MNHIILPTESVSVKLCDIAAVFEKSKIRRQFLSVWVSLFLIIDYLKKYVNRLIYYGSIISQKNLRFAAGKSSSTPCSGS